MITIELVKQTKEQLEQIKKGTKSECVGCLLDITNENCRKEADFLKRLGLDECSDGTIYQLQKELK